MIYYTLSPEEVKIAKDFTKKRNAASVGLQQKAGYITTDRDWEIQLNSVCAEIACSRILKLPLQLQLNQFLTNTPDLKYKNYRIDVKWSNKGCYVRPSDLKDEMIYAFFDGYIKNQIFLGMISGRKIKELGTLSDMGIPNRPKVYLIDQKMLKIPQEH